MSEVTAPTAAPAAPAAGTEHRARLLEGMARAVAAKGYADTTIADIVREASVSRRTFYENFADKAECLTALYEAASGNAIAVLRAAIDPHSDWEAQVEQAMAAYFGVLVQELQQYLTSDRAISMPLLIVGVILALLVSALLFACITVQCLALCERKQHQD